MPHNKSEACIVGPAKHALEYNICVFKKIILAENTRAAAELWSVPNGSDTGEGCNWGWSGGKIGLLPLFGSLRDRKNCLNSLKNIFLPECVCFLFFLQTQGTPVTCRAGSECMNRISQENPGEGEKMNHLMQRLKFRKISVKTENITCVPRQPSSSSLGCAGARAFPRASGWGWDRQLETGCGGLQPSLGFGVAFGSCSAGWCKGDSEQGLSRSEKRLSSPGEEQSQMHLLRNFLG